MSHLVQEVIGRNPRNIDQMKPDPAMLLAATARHRGRSIMLGDSITDVIAASAAGIQTIGLAKNDRRAEELARSGARAVVRSMSEIER